MGFMHLIHGDFHEQVSKSDCAYKLTCPILVEKPVYHNSGRKVLEGTCGFGLKNKLTSTTIGNWCKVG